MFCPSRKHENREGRMLCAPWRVELALVCRSCGARSQPGERYCGKWGRNLADSPKALGQHHPRAYAPRRTDPCCTGGDERRDATNSECRTTALFADIKGSVAKGRPSTALFVEGVSTWEVTRSKWKNSL